MDGFNMTSALRGVGVHVGEAEPPVIHINTTSTTPGDPPGAKPTNPKDMLGANKVPLHLWPTCASAAGALALMDGAYKYGRSNFRAVGVRASIYKDALDRHTSAWFEGQDNDPQSGLPHLWHALACLAILVEAQTMGNMTDDRQYPTRHAEFMRVATEHVLRLKKAHENTPEPRHYTIQDKPAETP